MDTSPDYLQFAAENPGFPVGFNDNGGNFRSSCFAGSMIPGVVLVFVANARDGPVPREIVLCVMLCQEYIVSNCNFFYTFLSVVLCLFVCVCV